MPTQPVLAIFPIIPVHTIAHGVVWTPSMFFLTMGKEAGEEGGLWDNVYKVHSSGQ